MWHRTHILLSLLVSLLSCMLLSSGAKAVAHSPLIIILVPDLRSSDLTRPELWGYDLGGGMRAHGLEMLMPKCAIGWMNCRTARVPGQHGEPEEAAYVTLGAGARATSGPYARRITPESLARLTSENAKLDHPVQVGALGDMIRSTGGATTVVGNEDDVEPRRAGLWVLADHQGIVDHQMDGTVGGHTFTGQDMSSAPFGLRSWLGYFDWPSSPREVALWYYGDLARAGRYAPLCVPGIAAQHRSEALRGLTGLLMKTVISEFHQEGPAPNVILVSTPPEDAVDDRLVPVLMWGPDVKPGLLTSGSTHTPGLVTNTDFLPTVASLLGLNTPAAMVGRPMTVMPVPHSHSLLLWLRQRLHIEPTPMLESSGSGPTVELWARMHDDWYANARQQAALGGLPTIQALLVALTFALGLRGGRLRRLSASLPLAALWLPLLLLLLPAVSPSSVAAAGVLLGVLMALPVALGAVRPQFLRGLAVLPLAALVVLTLLDLLVDTPLMRQAWMSYSVMEGARYYGIGNEYCGAILGALLGCALLLRGLPVWTVVSLSGVVTALVGWPGYGANAGGLLGLAAGFGVAAVVWWRGRLQAREVGLLVLVIGLAAAGAVVWDLSRSAGEQTHYARALGGGPLQIALRKTQLNAWLLIHSPWSLALLASGASLLYLWNRGPLRSIAHEDRRTAGAMAGLVTGALALFLLNDSGVVAAAEALMVAWAVAAVVVASPSRTGDEMADDARDAPAIPAESGSSQA